MMRWMNRIETEKIRCDTDRSISVFRSVFMKVQLSETPSAVRVGPTEIV